METSWHPVRESTALGIRQKWGAELFESLVPTAETGIPKVMFHFGKVDQGLGIKVKKGTLRKGSLCPLVAREGLEPSASGL